MTHHPRLRRDLDEAQRVNDDLPEDRPPPFLRGLLQGIGIGLIGGLLLGLATAGGL